MPEFFDNDAQRIEAAAVAMRRQADAALDGVRDYAGIPPHWAYTMLALAGFMETEVRNHNARTRPFSVAAARAFWRDLEEGDAVKAWLPEQGA
jgi:hypothetical protein